MGWRKANLTFRGARLSLPTGSGFLIDSPDRIGRTCRLLRKRPGRKARISLIDKDGARIEVS
jgi:hypothetical protein